MKRVLTLLMSIVLLFTTFAPYHISADDEVTVTEQEENYSYEKETEILDEMQDGVIVLDEEDVYETNDLGNDNSNDITVEEDANGDILIHCEDTAYIASLLESGGIRLYRSEYDYCYVCDSAYNIQRFHLSSDGKTLIVPNYCLWDGSVFNGDYILKDDNGNIGKPITITKGMKEAPAVEDISINVVNDQIFISCDDSEWLSGLVKISKSDYYQSTSEELYERGGSIAINDADYTFDCYLSNHETYVDGTLVGTTTRYELIDGSVVIPADIIRNYKLASDTYGFDFRSFGYDDISVTASIETSLISTLPDDINVYYDNGLYIHSEDTEWIDGIVAIADKNGIAGIELRHVDWTPSYQFYNDMQTRPLQIVDEKTIFISENMIRNYDPVQEGDYTVSIYSKNYSSTYTTEEQFHIAGVEAVPLDVSVSVNNDGDIIINSDNKAYLQALATESQSYVDDIYMITSEFGGRIYLLDANKTSGNAVRRLMSRSRHIMNYDEYNHPITYDQEKEWVTIKHSYLANYNLEPGNYSVWVFSPGYKWTSSTIEIKSADQYDSYIDVTFENGDLVITSKNTDLLNKIVQPTLFYENSPGIRGGSITLWPDEGESYYFGNYRTIVGEKVMNEVIDYYLEGNKVIVPADTFIRNKVLSGNYRVQVNIADEIYPVVEKKVDIVTDVKNYPDDISVEYVDGKGLVIRSDDQDWLDAIYSYVDNSYISLDKNNIYYQFYNSNEYDRSDIEKEDGTVYVPEETIVEQKIVSDTYNLLVSARGYVNYAYPENIYINSGVKAPELYAVQSNGDLIISSDDVDYLQGLCFVELRNYYEGTDSVRKSFAFSQERNDFVIDKSKKTLTIKSTTLKQKGVSSDTYEVTTLPRTGNLQKVKDVYIDNVPYTYNLIFNANGGKGKMTKITGLISGSLIEMPENEFTKASYNFAGWGLKAKGNEFVYTKFGQFEAKSNNQNITVYATWSPVLAESMTITSNSTITGNAVASTKSVKFTANVTPTDAANKKVSWKIVDLFDETADISDVAKINSSGVVTAKKVDHERHLKVIATAEDGSDVTAELSFTVRPLVQRVHITMEEYGFNDRAGQTISVDPEETDSLKFYSFSSPYDSSSCVTWTSSNKKLATVDDKGNVTILGSKGTVKITAKARDGSNKSATVTIRIGG